MKTIVGRMSPHLTGLLPARVTQNNQLSDVIRHHFGVYLVARFEGQTADFYGEGWIHEPAPRRPQRLRLDPDVFVKDITRDVATTMTNIWVHRRHITRAADIVSSLALLLAPRLILNLRDPRSHSAAHVTITTAASPVSTSTMMSLHTSTNLGCDPMVFESWNHREGVCFPWALRGFPVPSIGQMLRQFRSSIAASSGVVFFFAGL